MAITIAKENYPSFASGVGVSGKRQVLYVNYGEGATKDKPVWTLLGDLKPIPFLFLRILPPFRPKKAGTGPKVQ